MCRLATPLGLTVGGFKLPRMAARMRSASQLSSEFHPMNTLPLNDIYIVDTNLAIAFAKNEYPEWNEWAARYIEQGKVFFLLPQAVRELKAGKVGVPEGFVELQLRCTEMETPQSRLDSMFKEISEELELEPKMAESMRADIEMIASAGYHSAASSKFQISDDDYLRSDVVFASANFAAVERIVGTPEKRSIVERIVDNNAMEHLIAVRFISEPSQSWADYAF